MASYEVLVAVRSLDDEEMIEAADTASQGTGIDVIFNLGDLQVYVAQLDDDGNTERAVAVSLVKVQEAIARAAVVRGYVEDQDGEVIIDLGGFDPFELSAVFQTVAFGQVLVG